jgi:carboxypeptidase Taq
VHWSGGALGYFPSYALGAMLAAQLYAAARRDVPGLEDRLAAGDFAVLRDWLRAAVHSRGSVPRSADDLLAAATGDRLRPAVFLDYLRDKYSAVYGL